MEETPKVVFRKTHKEYEELLEQMEWRDFSREMIRRKGGKCEVCEADKNLELHHLGYKPGKLPWEYADYEVMAICHSCHGNIHEWADKTWNEILKCKNEWIIYECYKAVLNTMERHQTESRLVDLSNVPDYNG